MKHGFFRFFIFGIAFILLLGGCSSSDQFSVSEDWASNFVIWEGDNYIIPNEAETISDSQIEEKIGEVEHYTDIEGSEKSSKVSSNHFPVGTEIFKIKNVAVDQSIAVGDNGVFVKLDNSGKYGRE